MTYQIVLDTNVLIAGLRSRRGASFELLSRLGGEAFEINVSVPLVLEYEAVAREHARELGLTHADVDDVLDYLCAVDGRSSIFGGPFFLTRKTTWCLRSRSKPAAR